MQIKGSTRLLLALAAAGALVLYLVVVDLGIHAGRIHQGVKVQGIDLGGLTLPEAQTVLTNRGRELRQAPIVFTTEGFDCSFVPGQVGWRPRPSETAQQALEIGRRGGLWASVRERLRSWTGGVTLDWSHAPDARRMGAFVNDCARRGEQMGSAVNRAELRRRARAAIETWPRQQIHDLPLEGDAW